MIKVEWRFDLMVANVPQDIAVFTLHGHRNHTPGNVTDWPTDVTNLADGMWDAWATNVDDTYWSGGAALSEVNVYHLSTANKTLDKGVRAENGTNSWRGENANSLPWETSMCVSLYGYPHGTFVQEQRNKRGRFYTPPLATSVLNNDGSGAISSTRLAGFMTDMGAFLNDVQGMHIGTGPGAADYFQLAVLSVEKSYWTQVIEYGIDQVIDSQRRRRKSQVAVKQWDEIAVS